jgi:GDP-D-mannose dehydratase
VLAMWKMMQQKNPSDYVISTGKQYTVKEFVNLVLKELNLNFIGGAKVLMKNVMMKIIIV